jgi:hypothetical protein
MRANGIIRATVKRKEREFFKLVNIETMKSLKGDTRGERVDIWEVEQRTFEISKNLGSQLNLH